MPIFKGIVSAVELSRTGFPTRLPLEQFARVFRPLVRPMPPAPADAAACHALAEAIFAAAAALPAVVGADAAAAPWLLGKTKAFFKTGALDKLAAAANVALASYAVRIQAAWRRCAAQKVYRARRGDAAARIQSLYRGRLGRRAVARRRACIHQVRPAGSRPAPLTLSCLASASQLPLNCRSAAAQLLSADHGGHEGLGGEEHHAAAAAGARRFCRSVSLSPFALFRSLSLSLSALSL